jgi:hypothetical protein
MINGRVSPKACFSRAPDESADTHLHADGPRHQAEMGAGRESTREPVHPTGNCPHFTERQASPLGVSQ